MKTSCFKYYTGDMGVSICVYPPIDWTGLQFPTLAPDRQLFFAIKDGTVTNEQYEKQYREGTLAQLDPQFIYNMFKNNVLLCWERPGEFCHRKLVSMWMKENLNIEVPEWNIKDEQLLNSKNINPLF